MEWLKINFGTCLGIVWVDSERADPAVNHPAFYPEGIPII